MHICIRWLADYNLHTESMQLRTLKLLLRNQPHLKARILYLCTAVPLYICAAEEVNLSEFSELYQALLRRTNQI
ncbi:unnamed protein product [Dicrocoelium dendriticum]|nr:unnamed protein product [Dicrocoelium dendriticum]